jgi:hypothetical protein
MKAFTRTLAVLVSSLLLQACGSMNRASSDRMLDQRAGYGGGPENHLETIALQEGGVDGFRNSPVPVRTRPRVAPIWIHPHETATRDYFWGGWISVVVEQDQWVMSKPQLVPKAAAFPELPFKGGPPPMPLMPDQQQATAK